MSTVATRRRSGRRRVGRRTNDQPEPDVNEPIVLDDSVGAVNDSSCIDLTETRDDEFVDLTSSQSHTPRSLQGNDGANDNSVVVIGSPDGSPPAHRRTRRQRIMPTLDDYEDDDDPQEIRGETQEPYFPSHILNDSDEDLPEIPIKIPRPNIPPPGASASTSSTVLTSPEPTKLTCPVCFDDDKMIKRNNSKWASTSCGHVFCKPCLEGAVRHQHCCPVCRKKLTLKNIFVLHL